MYQCNRLGDVGQENTPVKSRITAAGYNYTLTSEAFGLAYKVFYALIFIISKVTYLRLTWFKGT